MAYFGVTFRSGERIIVEATSYEGAKTAAHRDHPDEEIVDIVYLTIITKLFNGNNLVTLYLFDYIKEVLSLERFWEKNI